MSHVCVEAESSVTHVCVEAESSVTWRLSQVSRMCVLS